MYTYTQQTVLNLSYNWTGFTESKRTKHASETLKSTDLHTLYKHEYIEYVCVCVCVCVCVYIYNN